MGGVIEVHSRFGHGSRFSFEIDLPAAEAPRSIIERAPHPEITGYRGSPRRILVVDDQRENRAVLADMLSPLGFEVLQAENGQAGLQKAREWKLDLILTDLVMPVMDGFALTRELRAHPDHAETPIIAVSASVFGCDTAKSREVGCDDFIHKPVVYDHLIEKLGAYLKLEWVYPKPQGGVRPEGAQAESSGPSPAPLHAASPDGTSTPICLPPEGSQRLRALAAKGDIKGVVALARELAEIEPRYEPFAKAIADLAERFKVKQIRQLIEDHTAPDRAIHPDSKSA